MCCRLSNHWSLSSLYACVLVSAAALAPTRASAGQCPFDWLPGQGVPGVVVWSSTHLPDVSATTTWDPDGAGPQPELLIAGGNFDIAGNVVANHIAAWDGTNWQPLGTGMGGTFAPFVSALTVYNGELIAGGLFTTAGGVSADHIARWNGTDWQSLQTGINGLVSALTVYNDDLIAGGQFTTADGSASNHWARWGPDCPRGDMNCDQVVDLTDIPLFVDALLNAPALASCESYTANVNADVHPNGTPRVDGLDVQAFVNCLLGGPCP